MGFIPPHERLVGGGPTGSAVAMPQVESPLIYESSEPAAAGPGCCGRSCWWGQAEYLLWWTRGMNVPALVTTGSAADPRRAALGQPNTQVLFGNGPINDGARSGGRFTLGRWLDPCRNYGFEVSYLFLGSEDANFRASNNEFAILGRPFFNTVRGAQDARLIASPGVLSGTVSVAAATEFQSLEVLYRQFETNWLCAKVDFVLGYRFAELEDRLRIGESTLSLAGPTAGTTFNLSDQFNTRSTFHGAEFGMVFTRRENPYWSWETVAKVAVGGSYHRADISGQTTITNAMGASATTQSGLLTQGTNVGTFRWDDFSVLSDLGITVRRHLPCGLTGSFGYSFLYWSDAARAGDQIDTTINPTQIPPGVLVGAARPAFPFSSTDFWAQGLRFGLDYNY